MTEALAQNLLTPTELPPQLWWRWWDVQGNLLMTGSERAIAAEQRAETAEEKAARLAEQLRELGVDPDLV